MEEISESNIISERLNSIDKMFTELAADVGIVNRRLRVLTELVILLAEDKGFFIAEPEKRRLMSGIGRDREINKRLAKLPRISEILRVD